MGVKQAKSRTTVEFTRISKGEISTEARLIDQAKGDPKHFEILYRRYHPDMFRYIYHKVRDEELAGDLTSQVFVKALAKLKKYQHRGLPFSAWLYRIAINEVNQYFRKAKRTCYVTVEDAGLEGLQEAMEDVGDQEAMLAALRDVLTGMPDKDVTLIDLRFFEQRPFKEIGDVLGITEANAKAKTYRILKKMRERMEVYIQHEQKIGNRP